MVKDYLFSSLKTAGFSNDVCFSHIGRFFNLIWPLSFPFTTYGKCEKFLEMLLDKDCLRIYKYRRYKHNAPKIPKRKCVVLEGLHFYFRFKSAPSKVKMKGKRLLCLLLDVTSKTSRYGSYALQEEAVCTWLYMLIIIILTCTLKRT